MKTKKLLALLLSLCMLLTMSLFAQADEEAALLSDENHAVTITIVHTNDTHARVKEGDGMGFAKISALIHQIKQEKYNYYYL